MSRLTVLLLLSKTNACNAMPSSLKASLQADHITSQRKSVTKHQVNKTHVVIHCDSLFIVRQTFTERDWLLRVISVSNNHEHCPHTLVNKELPECLRKEPTGVSFTTGSFPQTASILQAGKYAVLLSRTWDSRTRTRSRSQASRTRTRTWKLVLEDPRGQGLSSRTTLLWGSRVRSTWSWTWPGHNGK